MAGQNVLPIAVTGEYRADGAFRALSRDLGSARTQLKQSKTEMISLAGATSKVNLGLGQTGNAAVLAGRRTGALGGSMSQLSFQINDIVSGLLMGQSPFQIMTQQGGQVFQVWQMNNGIFSQLKEKIVGLITPGRALVLGFTAAAGAAYLLYRAVNDNGPSAADVLTEHKRIIGDIKTAYADAAVSAGKFFDKSKAVTLLQAQQNLLNLQDQVRKTSQKSLTSYANPVSVPLETDVEAVADRAYMGTTRFNELNRAINDFAQSARSSGDVIAFRDAIASIGSAAAAANPALAKQAGEILSNTAEMGEFAIATQKAAAGLRILQGIGTAADRVMLGLKNTTKASVSAYQQLIQRTRDRNAELKEEATQAGRTGNAVLALKLQHDAERAAKQSGVKVNQTVLDQLKQELTLRTDLKAKADLRADALFDRSQLGRTPGEAGIASQLRSAKLDPATAVEEAGILRVNQALTETRDLSRDALKGFIRDMRAGKSVAESFAGVLDRIASKLIDMAVDNLVANAFKPAASGGGGILGAFASIFGGFRAGGGDVQAGKGYVVGENGPEWFAPKSAGSIVPGLPGKGGGDIVIHQSFSNTFAGMTGTDRQWSEARMKQIAAQAAAVAVAEVRAAPQRRG